MSIPLPSLLEIVDLFDIFDSPNLKKLMIINIPTMTVEKNIHQSVILLVIATSNG